MNSEGFTLNEKNVGYLIVKVSTARGALPLKDAAVSIRGGTRENSDILYSMRTNSDGLTPKVALPAPPKAMSETANGTFPFSVWNIDVLKDGYIPVYFQNVPVYASITSIQPAVLVPISENSIPEEIYNESQAPNL